MPEFLVWIISSLPEGRSSLFIYLVIGNSGYKGEIATQPKLIYAVKSYALKSTESPMLVDVKILITH